mgnify:CR=1 FL=1
MMRIDGVGIFFNPRFGGRPPYTATWLLTLAHLMVVLVASSKLNNLYW